MSRKQLFSRAAFHGSASGLLVSWFLLLPSPLTCVKRTQQQSYHEAISHHRSTHQTRWKKYQWNLSNKTTGCFPPPSSQEPRPLTPVLLQLYWSPITHCIQCNILLLTYKYEAIRNLAPPYLPDLLPTLDFTPPSPPQHYVIHLSNLNSAHLFKLVHHA